MTSEQLIRYINDLSGVIGCYTTNIDGNITSQDIPKLFDAGTLENLARHSTNVLETIRSEMEDCNEVFFDMSAVSVYVRSIQDTTLIVLLDADSELAGLRIATNVVARRHKPSEMTALHSKPKKKGA